MSCSSKTIHYLYNLDYDHSSINSSLVRWYNKLLDKAVSELDVTDVSKMIRQDILKEVAVDKAICLFMDNPYAGEMQDGDLLSLLLSVAPNSLVTTNNYEHMLVFTTLIESDYLHFEWQNIECRDKFAENIKYLKRLCCYNHNR